MPRVRPNTLTAIKKEDRATQAQRIGKFSRRLTLQERLSIARDLRAGLSYREIGRLHFCDAATVMRVAKDDEIKSMLRDPSPQQAKKDTEIVMYHLLHKSASYITDQKLEKSSAYQNMMISAVAFDKLRLSQGQSTENISLHASIDELRSMKEKLIGRA